MARLQYINSQPQSVLCGDTNVSEVAEIIPFVNDGYTDSWAKMNLGMVGESTSPEHRYPSGSSYGLFGMKSTLDPEGKFPKNADVRRLDYVLARNLEVTKCTYVGTEPIKRGGLGDAAKNKHGVKEGILVWPSDHCGVYADLRLGSQSRGKCRRSEERRVGKELR